MREPEPWLRKVGVQDLRLGQTNIERLAHSGITIDLCESLLEQLEQQLPQVSDPDMALNNLERFFSASRSPLALGALLDRDRTSIPILLRIFSNSQYLADLLIRDPEAYDSLRMTEGQPIDQAILIDDLANEMRSASETRQAMSILRRFKHRETLRIAFGDIIAQQRLSLVTEQISYVAQAVCQSAYDFCDRQLKKKWGTPRDEDGNEIPFVILALGKFGGEELNYSSDIDLIMVFGRSGECDGPRGRSVQEFFEELTRDFAKLLSENTTKGFAYRVDLRLRPEGSKGRIVNPLNSLLQYYDLKGRTWERQAWIKARPVAGTLEFGHDILRRLNPWIYRGHLNRFEISGVKALKRQIEKRALVEGVEHRDIKTGHGGIRDIEFVIQFLQLLNGGRLHRVQTVNTLRAIEQLQLAGCLALNEEALLSQNYIWLRKLEHRLQIMYDLQTHELPEGEAELRKLAIRMGYLDLFDQSALEQFRADLQEVTELNRRILDHVLHTAFTEEDAEEIPPVVDLIFATEPTKEEIVTALSEYRFQDPIAAGKNLISCADETTPFLPPNRCRHFFAAIAPRLLKEIDLTPDPDATLVALASVSETLGAKGVLWELFATAPTAMQLFVRMGAVATSLTEILRHNPGMIDELVDALSMQGLPTRNWLDDHLQELLQGAAQLEPIIHRYKQAQCLRVGIRDLMGHESHEQVSLALSNIADTCLHAVAHDCYEITCRKFGVPQIDRDGEKIRCNYAIVACGKLAGQELNFQSDLDLIFVFESDGQTAGNEGATATSNQHFFSHWAAEVTKRVAQHGPYGKLYDLDSRLRPSGKSGSLATSLDELRRYFRSGDGQTWERLVLCKSRIVLASDFPELPRNEPASMEFPTFANQVEQALVDSITATAWRSEFAEEILAMRIKMQHEAHKFNLKRTVGGTVDIEFLTQLVQLRYLAEQPQLREPNTVLSLRKQIAAGLIEPENGDQLIANYRSLRRIENALRLTTTRSGQDLGDDQELWGKVAYLLRHPCDALQTHITAILPSNRTLLLDSIEELSQ